MHPLRISLITYNIWGEERWDFRKNALRRFLETFQPDVLCLQEFSAGARNLIDAALPLHARVEDAFEGWTRQSNIYWRKSVFADIEHGAEEVDIRDEATRRLFWVRLHVESIDRSVLVATAHLTHQRHPDEVNSGQSTRVGETRRIAERLRRLNREGEPLFFMGDLNDAVHPPNILAEAGYVSCFAALGIAAPPTFKVYPTADVKQGALAITQCVDWIVANDRARPIAASSPRYFFEDAAPSDHWPVHAVYEI